MEALPRVRRPLKPVWLCMATGLTLSAVAIADAGGKGFGHTEKVVVKPDSWLESETPSSQNEMALIEIERKQEPLDRGDKDVP